MKKNKISIVVPVHNGEKFIERCLNSIIKQTYQNFEVIIINNGSTDKTEELIKGYITKYSEKVFYININRTGVSIARNIGIDKSTGDYITFVDVDDWLEENALENVIEVLKCQYDVVKYNYYINYSNDRQKINYYDKNLVEKKLERKRIHEDVVPQILSGEMPAYVWNLFIKTSIAKKIERFNENLNMMEDTIFFMNLLVNINNIYIMTMPLYHYFYNLDSASHSTKNSMRNLYDMVKVNQLEIEIIYKENLNKKNIDICNKLHTEMIDDTCFNIYKNTNIKDFDKKIQKIINNKDLNMIVEKCNLKKIIIKRRIAIKLIKKRKIFLLKLYYFIRKICYKIKKTFTKRNV